MKVRRRAGGTGAAVFVSLVAGSMAAPSCQRGPAVVPTAAPATVASSRAATPPPVRTNFDRAVAALEERTGQRLTLTLGERDYTAVYPAWLPDNRLVVPGRRVTIVEPRQGAVTPVIGKGQRAVVSPDGKTIVIASTDTVELLDVEEGVSLDQLEAALDDDREAAIQFSPDGKLLAFPMREGRVTGKLIGLYDVTQRKLRGTLDLRSPNRIPTGLTAKHSAPPAPGDSVAAFVLRNDRLIASLSSGSTALWDTASLDPLLHLAGGQSDDAETRDHRALLSEDGAFATAWIAADGSATGRAKATPAPPGILRVERRWTPVLLDARRGEVVMRLEDKQCPAFGVAMHPHEPALAVGSLYPGYCVWDLAKRKVKRRFRIPSAAPKERESSASLMLKLAAKMSPKVDLPIAHVAFDATGERLTLAIAHLGGIVVRLSDGSVSEGALSKDSHLEDFPGPGAVVTSPDRSLVAASGSEPRVWDVASGRIVRRIGQHEKHAVLDWNAESFSIVGVDGTLVRFRAGTGELAERRARPASFGDVKTVSSGAGQLLMLSSRPGGLRAMRLDEPDKVVPLAWPGGAMDGIVAAAASGNGRRLAVSTSDALAVFDAASGTSLRGLGRQGVHPQESHAATDLALDDEGQLVAAVIQDAPRLWEVTSGREIPLSAGDCTDVKFQPKSHLLVGSCRDKLRVWDARTGTLISAVDSGDLPEGIFFDASGERMAQVGAKYLTLLDGPTLVPSSRTEAKLPHWTAAFSPSSRFIALGIQNGDGVEFYRVSDGKRAARLQMWPNDEAWIARTEQGQVEVLGDVDRMKQELECRVGPHPFPLAACERLFVKGLFAQILSGRTPDAP